MVPAHAAKLSAEHGVFSCLARQIHSASSQRHQWVAAGPQPAAREAAADLRLALPNSYCAVEVFGEFGSSEGGSGAEGVRGLGSWRTPGSSAPKRGPRLSLSARLLPAGAAGKPLSNARTITLMLSFDPCPGAPRRVRSCVRSCVRACSGGWAGTGNEGTVRPLRERAPLKSSS